jgi:hypothetical protein
MLNGMCGQYLRPKHFQHFCDKRHHVTYSKLINGPGFMVVQNGYLSDAWLLLTVI